MSRKSNVLSIADQIATVATEAAVDPVETAVAAEVAVAAVLTLVPEVVPTAPVSAIGIRKGVPLPSNAKGKTSAYPWATMEVGDMFFVAGGKINSFHSHCSATSKAKGKTFIARKFTDGEVEGVGVWRTV